MDSCTAQGYREYFAFGLDNASSPGSLHYGGARNVSFVGQVCKTSYVTANIPVNVSTTSTGSMVSFHKDLFQENKKPLEGYYLNIDEFENDFIEQTGANHLRPTVGFGYNLSNIDQNSNFKGPALVLAGKNNYNIATVMRMSSKELEQQAATVKQRFLGEVLLSKFSDLAKAGKRREIQASLTEKQLRLVVDLGIGITLGLLFAILAAAAVALAFLAALSKRPLELLGDPNQSTNIALALNDETAAACFKDSDRASRKELKAKFKDQTFFFRNGKLIRRYQTGVFPVATKQGYHTPTSPNSLPSRFDLSWRPTTLRRRVGSLLVMFTLAVAVALTTLYAISKKRPLYQSAFVYESDMKIGDLRITNIAPYSIIPTLLAVGVKLWWTTIDVVYRRLTPFLAMTHSPTPKASRGASVSFITTPIFYITLLALRKRFWLLALVTFGSLTTEILQVSMSALWDREPGVLEINLNLPMKYELRSYSHVFEDMRYLFRMQSNIAYPNVAKHLYGGELYHTSWIYGSLAELAFGSLPPAWSKDGWSFPPVDLSGVSHSLPKIPTANRKREEKLSDAPSTNVTFDSIGLRGRVECTPTDNSSQWVVEVRNFTNLHLLDSKGNVTTSEMKHGYQFSEEIRKVNFSKFEDSEQQTVAIGQWLHFNYSSKYSRNSLYQSDQSRNFTVLWINASHPYRYKYETPGPPSPNPPIDIIFKERPQIQALNCEPIFEKAKTRLVVNNRDSRIQEYTILEQPKPATEAWDDNFSRRFSDETAYYESVPSSNNMDQVVTYNTTVRYVFEYRIKYISLLQ